MSKKAPPVSEQPFGEYKPPKSQQERFIEKARELGCDEDETAFRDKLRRIAKAPPPKDHKPKKKAPAK